MNADRKARSRQLAVALAGGTAAAAAIWAAGSPELGWLGYVAAAGSMGRSSARGCLSPGRDA